MSKTTRFFVMVLSPLAYIGFAVGFVVCPLVSGFWYGLNYVPMLNGEDYAEKVEQAIYDMVNEQQNNSDVKLFTEDEDENNA